MAAAVRRVVSSAAAAGRNGLATLGRQDALYTPVTTVRRTLASPTAGGKLGLGARGLQVRSIWTTGPRWMDDHLKKVAVDPELAFRNLRADDKDLVALVRLLMSDQTSTVLQIHAVGLDIVRFHFNRLYEKQLELEQGLWALVFVLAAGGCSVALFVKDVKDQSSNLLENLASHSGAIVAALVGAAKHGVNSRILGKGEPFVWDPEWQEKKKEDKTDTEKKADAENSDKKTSFGKKYKSKFFSKQEEK